MKSLTEILTGSDFEAGLVEGATRSPIVTKDGKAAWAKIRKELNLKGTPKLLTAPADNLKLEKSSVPTWGLTLQHYVQKLSTGLTINACPSAGDCTKVCVLDNGNGYFPAVQIARRARTEFFVREPWAAGLLLGAELRRALEKNPKILFRPNVNSDVEWHVVAPSLTNGTLFGDALHSYGYTKLESVMTETVSTKHYTVVYSVSEKSDWNQVNEFLANGGNAAVVTNRRPKSPITQWHESATIVDADKTDEWMLKDSGIIGDLSAKGKAYKLVGKSNFVHIIPEKKD